MIDHMFSFSNIADYLLATMVIDTRCGHSYYLYINFLHRVGEPRLITG
jgi:hypothetical protein